MSVLKTVLREAVALFIDDGSFAVAILVWLLAAWLGRPLFADSAPWFDPALAAGLALILVESTLRRARKPRGRQ